MKFIFTGAYREFRGYVFFNGNPVEVTDRGTLELLKNDPQFKEIKDEKERQETAPEAIVLKKFNRSEWMKKMHAEGKMRKK